MIRTYIDNRFVSPHFKTNRNLYGDSKLLCPCPQLLTISQKISIYIYPIRTFVLFSFTSKRIYTHIAPYMVYKDTSCRGSLYMFDVRGAP